MVMKNRSCKSDKNISEEAGTDLNIQELIMNESISDELSKSVSISEEINEELSKRINWIMMTK